MCECVRIQQQQTHREIKAEPEREREGEAHYNQAIMLAELEASLFSLVAA